VATPREVVPPTGCLQARPGQTSAATTDSGIG
jgi:hypothetical protein